ncbi:hypothetical protein B0G80_5945 [Paraburkholderia sp. BL6669N2]|nr:hypothetical protein B0G80_5945 [Paraburkholderia sp. BL6669N2]
MRRRLSRVVFMAVTVFCVLEATSNRAQTPEQASPDDSLSAFFAAFRGKPVATVPAPSLASPSNGSVGAVGGAIAEPARQAANVPPVLPSSSCPPGVDRLGCPQASGNPYARGAYSQTCPPGYQRDPTGCVMAAMPPHAHRQGDAGGWVCDFGFARTGDVCAAPVTPPNAHLANTSVGWECDRGFHLIADRCAQVFIPSNAHLSVDGGRYECNYGYRDIGMSCVP